LFTVVPHSLPAFAHDVAKGSGAHPHALLSQGTPFGHAPQSTEVPQLSVVCPQRFVHHDVSGTHALDEDPPGPVLPIPGSAELVVDPFPVPESPSVARRAFSKSTPAIAWQLATATAAITIASTPPRWRMRAIGGARRSYTATKVYRAWRKMPVAPCRTVRTPFR
jgi:hypothetical protein